MSYVIHTTEEIWLQGLFRDERQISDTHVKNMYFVKQEHTVSLRDDLKKTLIFREAFILKKI